MSIAICLQRFSDRWNHERQSRVSSFESITKPSQRLKSSEAMPHEVTLLSIVIFSQDIEERVSPRALYLFFVTFRINQTQIAKLWDMGYDPTKGISSREPSGFWNGGVTFRADHDPTRETSRQHRLPTTHTLDHLPQCKAIANRV
jgi:hypothetical protein